MQYNNENRIDWIDSIRGIAALLVVVYHIFGVGLVKASGSMATLFHYFDLGKIGVILFFFVSGFVIPYSLFKYKSQQIQSFCISRFFRLYPVYWVSILLYLLFVNANYKPFELILNISMLQKFFNFNDIIGVYWTLQIELIFYVLCIALFWKGYLHRTNTYFIAIYINIAVALVLAALRMILKLKLPVALPLALAVMFMGAIWKKFLFNEAGVGKRQVGLVFIAFFVAMVPITLMAYNINLGFHETWYTYLLTYTVAPILFLSLSTFGKIKLTPFYFLGRISYSIYLLHLIVLEGIIKFGILKGNLTASIVFAIVVILGLSATAYTVVEKPFIDYGKYLINYCRQRVSKGARSLT